MDSAWNRKGNMKKLLIIAAVLAVAVASWFFFKKDKSAEVKYNMTAVKRGDVEIKVTATGTLQALTTVEVGSQVSGTIQALYADFNSIVKKGQILAQLDPTFLKAQVTQAEADLEKTQASAELARRNYVRAESLFARNMIAESDRDDAEAQYEQSKADIKSSKANIERLKTNLNYATIISPIDGVVISRDVDVGQTVAASLQAPTLFTIAQDLRQMEVNTSVDEADIGQIEDGQTAVFTVDAYPDRNFNATVKQVRLAPQIESNVVSYDVILSVYNEDMALKPGMTANVTILINSHKDVLKVPAAALKYKPSGFSGGNWQGRHQGGGQVDGVSTAMADSLGHQRPDSASWAQRPRNRVWVIDEKKNPRPIPVEIGISDGSFTEIITDKLNEGDSIITSQIGGSTSSSNNQQVNPFQPQFPGRGRR